MSAPDPVALARHPRLVWRAGMAARRGDHDPVEFLRLTETSSGRPSRWALWSEEDDGIACTASDDGWPEDAGVVFDDAATAGALLDLVWERHPGATVLRAEASGAVLVSVQVDAGFGRGLAGRCLGEACALVLLRTWERDELAGEDR